MKNFFKSKVFITILVIIFIITIGTVSFFIYMQINSGNLNAKSNISEIKKIDKELTNEESTEIKDSEYYPIENIYDIIHRMSNTKIIAEDNQIWGKLEITPENIASLKSLIDKINYDDKEYMIEVLEQAHPSAKWLETGMLEIQEKNIGFIEVITPAIDGDIFNLMFFAALDGQTLIGTFNCMEEELESWQPVAKAMVETLEFPVVGRNEVVMS